jgi:hypothetical protein
MKFKLVLRRGVKPLENESGGHEEAPKFFRRGKPSPYSF